MKVSVIVIVLMILCFIAGFCFGFRIKQRVYEVLLESWENAVKENHITTHETLMTIIDGYDGFINSYKQVISLSKQNASNDKKEEGHSDG